MISPDKFIRKAYLSALSGKGFGIYDIVLPKPITIPGVYVLISTQTKRDYQTTKCGHEWDCTILLDIIGEFQNGFADRSVVDDVETLILSAIDTWNFNQTNLQIPPFAVYDYSIDDSHDDFVTTPTKTIIRKLIRFRHKIGTVN